MGVDRHSVVGSLSQGYGITQNGGQIGAKSEFASVNGAFSITQEQELISVVMAICLGGKGGGTIDYV